MVNTMRRKNGEILFFSYRFPISLFVKNNCDHYATTRLGKICIQINKLLKYQFYILLIVHYDPEGLCRRSGERQVLLKNVINSKLTDKQRSYPRWKCFSSIFFLQSLTSIFSCIFIASVAQ